MNLQGQRGPHPITTHVRETAEQIRLANHATYGDRATANELYDTLGALVALADRLPQLLEHLAEVVRDSIPDHYYHDYGEDVQAALQTTSDRLDHARYVIPDLRWHLNQAFSAIGHVGVRVSYQDNIIPDCEG